MENRHASSNTLTARIAKQVPELDLDLPFSAIGSGYADRMGYAISEYEVLIDTC